MSYSALLRSNRAFRDLWLGQAISQLGDAFYYVIFMYMVEKITGRIAMVGAVGALEAIPYLIFGPYAGILADRMDRRKIMLLSDLISGFTLVVLASLLLFEQKPHVSLLLVTPFILSSVRVFFMPAKGAALPALVAEDQVQSANAFSMMTQSLMPMIGLSLSASVLGIIYDRFPQWFFFTAVCLNALSFFGSALYIQRLPAVLPDRKDLHEVHPLADFKEGVRFMRNRRDLVVLTLLLTFFRLMVAPFFVVYVAANKVWFGGRPQPLAWFEFSFFLGMIVSSWVVGKMKQTRPGLSFSIGLGVVGFTVAAMGGAKWVEQLMATAGLSTTLLGLSASFWMFVFWNVVAGLFVPYADIPINTYMQLSVPDAFRGRVNAVLQMVATGVMPIGMAMGGILVDRIGVVAAFVVMGVGMALTCFAGLLDRDYRQIRMPRAALVHVEHNRPPEPAVSLP